MKFIITIFLSISCLYAFNFSKIIQAVSKNSDNAYSSTSKISTKEIDAIIKQNQKTIKINENQKNILKTGAIGYGVGSTTNSNTEDIKVK